MRGGAAGVIAAAAAAAVDTWDAVEITGVLEPAAEGFETLTIPPDALLRILLAAAEGGGGV
jgi:hypothetical protein